MIAVLAAAAMQGWALPASRPCTDDQLAELSRPSEQPYRLTCRAVLSANQTVTRRILIEGAEASGAGIDCRGGSLGVAGARTTTQAPTVAVWSRRIDGARPLWSRPTDVTLRDCVIHGAVRIWGMGAGQGMSALQASSRTPGHTVAVQAVAPSHVRIEGVTFRATGSIPLYVGPGVTDVTVTAPRFTGVSDSAAIYLDAESARTTVAGGMFGIATGREQIAVDGSAANRIVGNRFALRGRGGVFLYRNCGEDGVIRHQTPSGNLIADNVFTGASRFRPRTVVVGSREGGRRYCGDDAGYPFGSSADDGDGAEGNVVRGNRTER